MYGPKQLAIKVSVHWTKESRGLSLSRALISAQRIQWLSFPDSQEIIVVSKATHSSIVRKPLVVQQGQMCKYVGKLLRVWLFRYMLQPITMRVPFDPLAIHLRHNSC